MRFIVTQNMGIFIGTRRVKAPVVYCLEDVKELRYCMKAFRQRVKHCRGNYNVFDFSLHMNWRNCGSNLSERLLTCFMPSVPVPPVTSQGFMPGMQKLTMYESGICNFGRDAGWQPMTRNSRGKNMLVKNM